MMMLVFLLTAMHVHAGEGAAVHKFEKVQVLIAYQDVSSTEPFLFSYPAKYPSRDQFGVEITTDAYEKMKADSAKFFAVPSEHIRSDGNPYGAKDLYCLTVTNKETFKQLQKVLLIDLAQWENDAKSGVITQKNPAWYESLDGIIDSDFARGRIAQEIIDRKMATCESASNIYILNRNVQQSMFAFKKKCCIVSQKLTDAFTHCQLQPLCETFLQAAADNKPEDIPFYTYIGVADSGPYDQKQMLWAHLCKQEEGKRYMEAWVKSLNAQQRMQLQDAMNYDGPSAVTNQVWQAIKRVIDPALKSAPAHVHIDDNDDHNFDDKGGLREHCCKKALFKKIGITALITASVAAAGYWAYTRHAATTDDNAQVTH
jgi:hypothetical protein